MSPEVAVSSEWRKMFDSAYVKQQLVLVAVDEAHCIPEWLVSSVRVPFLVNAVFPCVYIGVWTSEKLLDVLESYEH